LARAGGSAVRDRRYRRHFRGIDAFGGTQRNINKLKLGFYLGAQPWGFMATSTWSVTHPHLDQIAALPVYVARRWMMKMEPPTIYLHESAGGLPR
jgi:ribonuclease BN (tRNA processing enzyme)